jgi:hypothetical protein
MANKWMTHMKPYIAEEKASAKKTGRKFSLKNAIKAAKKTYKKVGGSEPVPEGGRRRKGTRRNKK